MENYKKRASLLGLFLIGFFFFGVNVFANSGSCGVSYKNVRHTIPVTENGVAKYYLEETIPTKLSFTVKGEDASMQNYIDVVLVMDRSGSMDYSFGKRTRMSYAKEAMNEFIDTIAGENNVKNKIGLVSFSSSTTLDASLTNNYNLIKNRVNSLYASGATSIGGGLLVGANHLKQNAQPDAKQFIILASDGMHNTNPSIQAGIATVSNKTTVYTIGIGENNSSSHFDEAALKNIAQTAGTKKGKYFYANVDELNAIFNEIIKEIRPPFEMKDISVEFPVDETHASLLEVIPSYINKVGNTLKWNNLGSMKNEGVKEFTLDYKAKNPVIDGHLSGDFVKVSYVLFGKNCSDIVPFTKESLSIIKPKLVFKSSSTCSGVVSPFMSDGDEKEITLCDADTSTPVQNADWTMIDASCVSILPGGDETRKIKAMKIDCTTTLKGNKFPYTEANLFLGVFDRVNPPIPLLEQNIFREVTP
ncbi:MAG: VWA domain-containing protein [Candidatus Moranbacteria bacterium]|nr:VWA domain-containing protein [Candidatus Moranbacteria bacterium]